MDETLIAELRAFSHSEADELAELAATIDRLTCEAQTPEDSEGLTLDLDRVWASVEDHLTRPEDG